MPCDACSYGVASCIAVPRYTPSTPHVCESRCGRHGSGCMRRPAALFLSPSPIARSAGPAGSACRPARRCEARRCTLTVPVPACLLMHSPCAPTTPLASRMQLWLVCAIPLWSDGEVVAGTLGAMTSRAAHSAVRAVTVGLVAVALAQSPVPSSRSPGEHADG